MNNLVNVVQQSTPEQRKEKLIRDGARYRSAIRHSREVVTSNLRPDKIARSLVSHVTGSAYAAVGNLLRIKSGNLQTLIPVITGAVSLLVKKRLFRPLWRPALIAGAVGAVGGGVYLFVNWRKARVQRRRS